MITQDIIQSRIDSKYSPFFKVTSPVLSNECESVIESFLEAVKIFAPKIKLTTPFLIFIGTSPFNGCFDYFNMMFESKNGSVNFVAGNWIFLDIVKISYCPKEIQIASIIEEFVHAYMNVSNEDLTKLIVCDIYNRVGFIGNRYVVNSE